MPRGENEKDRGTHGEQPPPRRGAIKGKRQRGDKASRACAHTHTTTPTRHRGRPREQKKKKKTKRLFDCVTQALGCGMWDLVP